MCRAEDDLSAVLEKLNADLEYYAFSADTRAEQRGDGKDSYLRSHAEAETERKGTPDETMPTVIRATAQVPAAAIIPSATAI